MNVKMATKTVLGLIASAHSLACGAERVFEIPAQFIGVTNLPTTARTGYAAFRYTNSLKESIFFSDSDRPVEGGVEVWHDEKWQRIGQGVGCGMGPHTEVKPGQAAIFYAKVPTNAVWRAHCWGSVGTNAAVIRGRR